ncbi:hypothetical protein RBB75_01610 [Tunturibacter empetritectus]|uniref:Uncharacterized protein n=1 Tax=Tunturiibacter empetritectus TaxID=3069691 RepID=A0AAU7ZE83_9BACT
MTQRGKKEFSQGVIASRVFADAGVFGYELAPYMEVWQVIGCMWFLMGWEGVEKNFKEASVIFDRGLTGHFTCEVD